MFRPLPSEQRDQVFNPCTPNPLRPTARHPVIKEKTN